MNTLVLNPVSEASSKQPTGPGSANERFSRTRGVPKILWPLLALGLILLFNYVYSPGFFHIEVKDGHFYGSLIDVVHRAVPVMLLSLGMTWVIATGGVDLSVGAVIAISGAVAATVLQSPSASLSWAIMAALGSALICGLWNSLLVAWLEVQPIVATLVLMVAGRGIAQLLTGGQVISVTAPGFNYVGGGFLFGLPFGLTLVAVAAGFVAILSRKTALGLLIEAVGNNPVAARYAGVNSTVVKAAAYFASALTAGLAGLVIASDIGAADANNAGLYLELDAILAAVIGGAVLTGGRFSLAGSLVGALVIQAITTTINTQGYAVELTLVIKALVILGICLIQSERLRGGFARMGSGLFGRRSA